MDSFPDITRTAYDFVKAVAMSIQTIETQYATYLFAKYICDSQPIHPEQHEKFMNTLFIKNKSMSADNYLQIELAEIACATSEYNINPKLYPSKKTDHGYPDEFRCNFVKLDKIHLKRCANKTVDNEFYCVQHINIPNKYLRDYEKAIAELH